MDSYFREIGSCRICGRESLDPILSLGDQHVSDFINSPDEDTIKAPLELVLCNADGGGCGLLQLRHTVNPEYLFREYWYKSGINESMEAALHDIVLSAQDLAEISAGDTIVDIGCNDGTMLHMFDDDLNRIGFEPAENIVREVHSDEVMVINEFFDADTYYEWHDEPAKVVTSIAMFYGIDDPNSFVRGVCDVLADDGVWVIQMAYLPRKLEANAFDSIVHEHLEYYSLLPLENLLERHGLEVFDMETNDVNGGSFRVYVRKKRANVTGFARAGERLAKFRQQEKDIGLYEKSVYEDFTERIQALKKRTVAFIEEKVAGGESVYIYGASTKGNTLLQFYGLDKELIEGAAERDSDKYGKITVGTHIPIVPEEEARREADYFLALPWHFMDVFVERESEFLRQGGKFIQPLPEFEIIGEEAIPEAAETRE